MDSNENGERRGSERDIYLDDDLGGFIWEVLKGNYIKSGS